MWEQIVSCTAIPEVAFCIPWFGGAPLPIYWYGILASIGIFVGAFYAAKHVEKEGDDPELVWDALLWVLIAGLIGARLWYVLAEVMGGSTDYSFARPLEIINPRGGGMNIFGGAVGGLIAMYIYSRVRKIDGWLLADAGLMGLLLGQAIGRVGNFINQELYGPPTGSPWFGMLVRADNRLPEFTNLPAETRFHPTMIYELIWLLISFGVLFYIFRRYQDRMVRGILTGSYLILFGIGRFIMEFWRPDQPTFNIPSLGMDVSFSRIAAMLAVVAGIVVLLDRLGYMRIPFIARPQTRKQRLQAYQDILTNRRRQERAAERDKQREARRKARQERSAERNGEPVATTTTDTPSGEAQ